MEKIIITFKTETQIYTSKLNWNGSITDFFDTIHAGLLAVGFNNTVIFRGIAQYVSDYDYGYELTTTSLIEGDSSNLVITVKSEENDIKVELPCDASILDVLNAVYAMLIQMTFGYKTIENYLIDFYQEHSKFLELEEVEKDNVNDTADDTADDTAEEQNKLKSKDPFIQRLISKIKEA
jgi:hypothetical protein